MSEPSTQMGLQERHSVMQPLGQNLGQTWGRFLHCLISSSEQWEWLGWLAIPGGVASANAINISITIPKPTTMWAVDLAISTSIY